jgi:hypothetical protein
MKIRTGFVSNSSSSSFVAFVRQASLKEIDNENVMLMLDGGEGQAYGRPERKMIEVMKENPDLQYNLYYEYISFGEDAEIHSKELLEKLAHFALNPPKEKVIVKSFQKSYYFPETMEDFERSIGVRK